MVSHPLTIEQLLFAGNEFLSDSASREKANWNAENSAELFRIILKFYGQEIEKSPTSQRLRLHVASTLGVSKTQLNFSQLHL